MNANKRKTAASLLKALLVLSAFICVHLRLILPVSAQEVTEVVANLAAGRVYVYVAKDGIAIGAVEGKLETGGPAPAWVQLSGKRVAIVLGAVEWGDPVDPETLRVARELPRLLGASTQGQPRMQQEKLNDIEVLGLALMELLRTETGKLHRKLELKQEEPLLEVVLVGYVEDYGPEVWKLSYHIVQEPLRGDYWHTRILRPRYHQLYPPEKGQPHTLVEIRYPPDEPGLSMLARLGEDPALARLRAGDARLAQVTAITEKGESRKAKLDDAADWLRALMNAAGDPGAQQVFAVIREERGFDWVVPPPERPDRVEAEKQQREPGAPTLKKKP